MKDLEEIEWELMCQEVKKKKKKRKKIKSKELTEFEITTFKREIEEKKNIKKTETEGVIRSRIKVKKELDEDLTNVKLLELN